jgi:hypothetical protein
MMPTRLENGGSAEREPSLPELVRSALDDARELVRAEVDLLKADLKTTLKVAATALIVLTAAGVLLALTLSLLTAAVVLALHGSATEALVAAAAINALVSGGGILWLRGVIRKGAQAPKEHAAHVVAAPPPQPRSHAS